MKVQACLKRFRRPFAVRSHKLRHCIARERGTSFVMAGDQNVAIEGGIQGTLTLRWRLDWKAHPNLASLCQPPLKLSPYFRPCNISNNQSHPFQSLKWPVRRSKSEASPKTWCQKRWITSRLIKQYHHSTARTIFEQILIVMLSI